MKTIILMRHSIPKRAGINTEELSLSEEGIALARSKQYALPLFNKCYSSPYKRAAETAALMTNRVTVADALKERIIGDASEDFWLRQYQDNDYHNPHGESLNDVRIRMKTEIDTVLADMNDGETTLVVSHATAICSYLLNFCKVEVTNAATKSRKITFNGEVILNGSFDPTNYFEINYEDNAVSSLRFHR